MSRRLDDTSFSEPPVDVGQAAREGGVMSENTTVVDAPQATRYELRLDDGTVAGYAEYGRRGGTTTFVHTLVEDAYGGRGFGSVLIRGALDAERAAGRGVVAQCPFVRGWIEKHPDYQDLVSPGR